MTLLPTEEAKDLGCGVVCEAQWGKSAPPACSYVAVIFTPKFFLGLLWQVLQYLVRILVENYDFSGDLK